MSEKRSVLAVGAHADDVEFQMAGTLSLLVKAGFKPHIMTLAKCDLDSNEMPRKKIARIRDQEAHRSAAVIGSVYHPAIVPDMMIFYEDPTLRKVAAVVREVQPTIVLLPSLNDYMEDHMNTARLVSACFVHAMRNYVTNPPRDMTTRDIFLYHAQPHSNRDGMRNFILPDLFVDITSEIDVKLKMLACYESQWSGSRRHRAWTTSLTTCDAPVLNWQERPRERAYNTPKGSDNTATSASQPKMEILSASLLETKSPDAARSTSPYLG
jgi:LmbE family N-acetylglucosaminyl deacetylase